MIKAIIFDLDDTLYPEEEFVMSGFNSVAKYLAKKYNLSSLKIFNILKSDFKSGIRGRNFTLLLKKLNLPITELKKAIIIYRNHQPKIRLYPDVQKILEYLSKNKKIKLGMISDGIVKTQKNKISALKIRKYFKVILLSDRLGVNCRKPDTKPFSVVLNKLGVKPEEAIYIADNPQKDFIGAKKLGIFTVRIKRKDGLYNQVKINNQNKADFTIFNLKDVKNLCQIKK